VDPAWVATGFTGAGVLVALGITIQQVRQSSKDLGEVSKELGLLSNKMEQVRESNPVIDSRIRALEQDRDFQRGRMHEISAMVAATDARYEERHSQLSRELERIRTKVFGG
jgi:uncharacterized coiled-coil protein SlyX